MTDDQAMELLCVEVAAALEAYPAPPSQVATETSPTGCLATCGDLRMRLFPVSWTRPARHLEVELSWHQGPKRFERPELMATFRRHRKTGDWLVYVGMREYTYDDGLRAFIAEVMSRVER